MGSHQLNQFGKIKRAVHLIGVMALAFAAVTIFMLGIQTQQPVMAESKAMGIGLIPDDAGVSDDPFNMLAYQGLLRAESELGIVGTVYTPTINDEIEQKIQECVDDGNELCISVGFNAGEATLNAADTYTDTDFAIVDATYDGYPDNLRGLDFDGKEAGYLAGVLAGHMTVSNTIGVVAGMPIPPVEVFTEGYRNGAQCANPVVNVLIDYTWDFVSREIGAQAAQDMIAQNADVIFGVGGNMGDGAVITATQSGVWGIGVDSDIYTRVFEKEAQAGTEKVLSSAVKKIDNVVFDTISDVISGTFTSGTVLYNLAEDGVGLAPFHEADSFVSQSVRDAIQNVTQGIINGTINVDYSCRTFLPVLIED